MRYDSEHKLRTRERILRAAAKAIRAEGPHRVGVAAVMRQAELTHGGFYAHFDSKEALIAAAIERMFEDSQRHWRRTTANRSPAEGLLAFIDFYLSPQHRDARRLGCPIPALAADLPRLRPRCIDAYATGARHLIEAIAEQLRALDHPEPDALASSVMAELVGALSLARGEPDRNRSDAMLAASRRLIRQRLKWRTHESGQ